MDGQRNVSPVTAVFVLTFLVVVASVGAFSLSSRGNSVGTGVASASTTSLSKESSTHGVDSSTVSPEGLQLQVNLNSSSVASHGSVTAQVRLVNTLDRNVTLTVSQNQNITTWNQDDFVCGHNPSDSLVGFAVYQGDFSARNVSAAPAPIQLAPPFYLPCAITFGGINDTTFLPDSYDTVSLQYLADAKYVFSVPALTNATTGYCIVHSSGGGGGSVDCAADPGLVGYWNDSVPAGGDLNLSSQAFTYFPPGAYTLVAADDWGQYVYAHFQVAPSANVSSSSASASSSLTGAALVAECPPAVPAEVGLGKVNVTTSSPAIVCIQLYYYGNVTQTLNTTELLSIGIRSIDGSSNFTVTPSQEQVTLGGPTNESEGTVIAYSITAKPGASGTYWLGVLTGTRGAFMLGSQPETCGAYGLLVAGTGEPDYSALMTPLCVGYPLPAATGMCTLAVVGCPAATIQGVKYPLLAGLTYFHLVGATSSP